MGGENDMLLAAVALVVVIFLIYWFAVRKNGGSAEKFLGKGMIGTQPYICIFDEDAGAVDCWSGVKW